jgi:DNA-binding winged helix-turn-helix (wHTH) protein/TolB-like protein
MTPTAKAVYRIENIEIDPSQCRVTFAGEERHLRRQAFHVLLYLLEQRHRTIGREELIENVWHGAAVTDDSLGQCISEIRKALGDDSQHSRFIKTVPKVGYRFIGLVEEGLRSPSAAQPAPQTKAVPEPKDAFSAHAAPPAESHELTVSSTPGWSRRRLAALLLVVASLGTFFLLRHFRVPAEFETGATSAILANPRRSVAVLGFKNLSGSSEDAWLSTALSDWLSTELAAGEQLRMVPPESVSRVRNELVLANLDSLSKADLDRVGKNLGVDLVLVGSYARL